MAAWSEIVAAAPELAAAVQARFEAGRHKTIATLRADGSPRISGIECEFVDGQLRFGSMDGARKLADLLRDPRFALHGPTVHPVEGEEAAWPGEVKVAGTAHRIAADPAGEGEGVQFAADITEVVHTHLDEEATMLIVEWWTPAGGLQRAERA
ncbi:MAG: hypothetical protein RL238_251 [Actinomycetota bacterium]|jgi:hypothetical protein